MKPPKILCTNEVTPSPTTPSRVAQKISRFIAEEVMDGEEDVEEQTPLLALGVIDSLSMVSLITFIQEEFGVDVPNDDVTVDNFEDVAAIARMVARQQASAETPPTGQRRDMTAEAVRVLEASGVTSRRTPLRDGATIHTLEVEGNTPTWVLLPGLGNPASSWGTVLKASDDTHRAIAVDFAGFGLSTGSRGESNAAPTWRDHVEHMLELIEERIADETIVLIGSSAGSLVALELARRIPHRIDALVLAGFGLIEDPVGWLRELDAMWGQPAEFLRRTFHNPPELTPVLQRQFDDVYGRSAYHSFLQAEDLAPEAFDGIEVPTLVLAGSSDAIVGMPAMHRAAARIGDNATLIELARCGHFPGQEQPEEMVFTLESYLRGNRR